ncbi:MAG: formate dehydrogenase accessory sulfurtransferase FdhD [Deltaproteobacteria bacterium]|nr:formate dehydrogenase accessory sulfurtransferase FdhD [Deltaproteobacteria bacterium]
MDTHGKKENKVPEPVFRFEKGKLRASDHVPVQEFPLSLIVNGRELATLISSPHDLRFLVAGFLRLQGFVQGLDDFQMFSVCEDFGVANVIIKGEIPEQLKPAITSGCGTGITFNLQQKMQVKGKGIKSSDYHFLPEDLFALMDQLTRFAGEYRKSGGIHSAAVGEGRTILLYSEDIGRHNTLDRIAGEALFKGINLAGKVLLTSGRVSTEMVAKAAMLGISLIASRTSPTDLAVQLAKDAGITLVGYLRASGFNIYTHPESLVCDARASVTSGVTAVILAGGKSTRMKSNKALLPYSGELFIERIHRQLSALFPEVILVTNTPELYRFLPCTMVPDEFPGLGSLAGIHAGLKHSKTEHIFVVACDMPYLNSELMRQMISKAQQADVVIPESDGGFEPLHAVYSKNCLPGMEVALKDGKIKIVDCLDWNKVTVLTREEIAAVDPEFHSFRNINTPEEYFRFREEMQEKKVEGDDETVSVQR